MTDLDEIRKKFPRAIYAPIADCSICGGTGVDQKRTQKAATLKYIKKGDFPCFCIFFGSEERAETARGLLNKALTKLSR